MPRKRIVCAVLWMLAMLLTLPAGAVYHVSPKRAGGPEVAFEVSAVVATGATPGATVYFASLSLKGGDYLITVERPTGQAGVDANGVARFPLAEAPRTRSIWIVVDGSTRGYTVACPPGMLLGEMTPPGGRWWRRAGSWRSTGRRWTCS